MQLPKREYCVGKFLPGIVKFTNNLHGVIAERKESWNYHRCFATRFNNTVVSTIFRRPVEKFRGMKMWPLSIHFPGRIWQPREKFLAPSEIKENGSRGLTVLRRFEGGGI